MGTAAGGGKRLYVVINGWGQPGYFLYAADRAGLAFARQALELGDLAWPGAGKQADRVVLYSVLHDYGFAPLRLERMRLPACYRGKHWSCNQPSLYSLESPGVAGRNTGACGRSNVPHGCWHRQSQRDAPATFPLQEGVYGTGRNSDAGFAGVVLAHL